MGLARGLLAGVGLGLVLVSCASFSYRWYGLDVETVDTKNGWLLGPKAEFDLPLAICKSSAIAKHPCVVLTIDEFQKMRRDQADLAARLKACESGG